MLLHWLLWTTADIIKWFSSGKFNCCTSTEISWGIISTTAPQWGELFALSTKEKAMLHTQDSLNTAQTQCLLQQVLTSWSIDFNPCIMPLLAHKSVLWFFSGCTLSPQSHDDWFPPSWRQNELMSYDYHIVQLELWLVLIMASHGFMNAPFKIMSPITVHMAL